MQERELHTKTVQYKLKDGSLAGLEWSQASCVHYNTKGILGRFCTMTTRSAVTLVIVCSASGLNRSFQYSSCISG
jgi:hypothetical protein